METLWVILLITSFAANILSTTVDSFPNDIVNDITTLKIIKRVKRDSPVQYIKTKLKEKVFDFYESETSAFSRFDKLVVSTAIDFQMKQVFAKRLVNHRSKLNRRLIHVSETYIHNEGTIMQQGGTAQFSHTYTKTNTITLARSAEIGGDIQIPLIDGAQMSFKFSETEETSNAKSEEISISSSSQPINVNPQSKVKVSFELYTYDDIYNYLVDLELDSTSKLTVYYKYLYSSMFSISRALSTNEMNFDLLSFLSKYKDYVNSIQYKNDDDVKLAIENGKFIMKNFPMEEKVINSELIVKYGPQESV